MLNNIKFGECLKIMLYTLDISMSRLAKAINVDSSLVNRWIHGKRVPLYNTTYIDNISEYLSKNVQNEFQMQRLNELFINIFAGNESAESTKEKISKALFESQGYSIECRMKDKIESKNIFSIKEDNIRTSDQNCYSYIALSSEDKVIMGNNNVFAASIDLLEAAANQKNKAGNTIYISFNNDLGITGVHNFDLIHWRNCVLKAIENGWNVLFFVRLSNSIERTIKLINFAKPLIKSGRFIPYYLKKYDVFTTGKETISIPGIGALSCFSIKPHSVIDYAFYFKNPAAVKILSDYFDHLLKTYAQPLFKYYTQENIIEYGYHLAESEENIGNRFLCKYGFSILILPQNLYNKFLKKNGLTYDEMQSIIEYYDKRRNSFLSNVQAYEHKDIYFAESIKYLIKERKFHLNYLIGIKIIDLEIQDIIEILQNIINLLKMYNNYNIAFIPKDALISCEFCCFVKERHAVLVEAYEPIKSIPVVRLSIKEPMLVKAFEEYFKEMWEHIAPVNKDKKEVIDWLQNQINSLESIY